MRGTRALVDVGWPLGPAVLRAARGRWKNRAGGARASARSQSAGDPDRARDRWPDRGAGLRRLALHDRPDVRPAGPAAGLVKLVGPAVPADDVGRIDVILLSHDHHADNLDAAGRAFLARARRVLTTSEGAKRLGDNAVGLEAWTSLELKRPEGGALDVTAVPAQHGPDGTDHLTGPVIGFVLTGEGVPSLYVSGDNASLDVVREIVARLGTMELAVLFAGGARLADRFDGAYLTLSNDRAVEAARILGARAVVPVHFHGWAHFSQGAETLRSAFAAAGLGDRLALIEPGASVTV